MHSPPTFRNQFQNGYIVRDLVKAQAVFSSRYGIRHWQVIHIPAGGPVAAIAKANVGTTMIELIEAVPGQDTVYSRFIPESDGVARFHHFGYLVDSADEFERIRQTFRAQGVTIAFAGSHGDILDFFFADTVAQLGHYCEFIHLKPAGRNFYADVPRN